jgi:hypothetical protein
MNTIPAGTISERNEQPEKLPSSIPSNLKLPLSAVVLIAAFKKHNFPKIPRQRGITIDFHER